jgi:hypothetical protein
VIAPAVAPTRAAGPSSGRIFSITTLFGLTALSSGAALLTYIVVGISLRIAASMSVLAMAGVLGGQWYRAGKLGRAWIQQTIRAGVIAGVAATAAYDASRWVLSRLDSSPYNPFEAVRIFGTVLAGPSATPATIYLTGFAFHLFNGISFAVAFAFLLGHRGIISGIGWGLGLEVFQLVLYPDWLQIRLYYREFCQISAFSHVVYGAVLGRACRHAMGDALGMRIRADPFLRR